jgi:hypothetical protein
VHLFDCRAVAAQVATVFRASRSGAVVLGLALTLGACAASVRAAGPTVGFADYAASPYAEAEQSSKIGQMNSLRDELKACIRIARENPTYGVLQAHFSDLSSDRFTIEQLTDDRVPTISESQLFAGYVDEVMSCNHRYADSVSQVSPAVARIIVDQESAIEQTLTLLVERQISWGEAARRQKQNQETAGAKLREVRV